MCEWADWCLYTRVYADGICQCLCIGVCIHCHGWHLPKQKKYEQAPKNFQ